MEMANVCLAEVITMEHCNESDFVTPLVQVNEVTVYL